jgi:hypothetical protein
LLLVFRFDTSAPLVWIAWDYVANLTLGVRKPMRSVNAIPLDRSGLRTSREWMNLIRIFEAKCQPITARKQEKHSVDNRALVLGPRLYFGAITHFKYSSKSTVVGRMAVYKIVATS